MIELAPVTLERRGVRLEPLKADHHDALAAAAADGELWRLWFTSVPAPGETHTSNPSTAGSRPASRVSARNFANAASAASPGG